MATRPIITKGVMTGMISLLDYCYKLGVESARDVDDDGLSREFLERTREAGVYGILREEPIYTTWHEWMLRLSRKAQMTAWDGLMTQFLRRIGSFGANYLSAFLPVSFMYYRMGIEDYISYPDAADINVFRDKTRVRWSKAGLRNIKPKDYVSDIQLMTFDLGRRDQALLDSENATRYMARKKALTAKQYEHFRWAISLVNHKKKYTD